MKNVFVTNGFWTTETLEALEGHLDAANVDNLHFTAKPSRERPPLGKDYAWLETLGPELRDKMLAAAPMLFGQQQRDAPPPPIAEDDDEGEGGGVADGVDPS